MGNLKRRSFLVIDAKLEYVASFRNKWRTYIISGFQSEFWQDSQNKNQAIEYAHADISRLILFI